MTVGVLLCVHGISDLIEMVLLYIKNMVNEDLAYSVMVCTGHGYMPYTCCGSHGAHGRLQPIPAATKDLQSQT